MKNSTRILFFTVFMVLLAITGLIFFGFHTMNIEDRYGELQTVYYEAENHDIIINNKARTIGFVDKNWKRINVIDQQNESIDLYNWVGQKDKEVDLTIYRLDNKIANFKEIEFATLEDQIKNEKLEFELNLKFDGISTTIEMETTQ